MDRTRIARAAHEINRAYCAALGDPSQPAWEDAPDWQKDSALAGVDMHLANPDATPEASHESWLAQKTAEGWKYGEVKNAETKEHPCFKPYAELPESQKAKDYLFRAVVHTLKDEPVAAAPSKPVVIDSAFVSVKYIGVRERYVDGAFGSHIEFQRGESCNVPAAIAAKMLKHPDVYVRGDVTARSEVIDTQQTSDEDENQDMRDSIARMDKDALILHAKTHYNVALARQMSVENMRTKVTGLFDQYGTK